MDYTMAMLTFLQRERDKHKAKNIIAERKKKYKVGKEYDLIVEIPLDVQTYATRPEWRRCLCLGKYEHWALFEYTAPATGNRIRVGYRWLDIREKW